MDLLCAGTAASSRVGRRSALPAAVDNPRDGEIATTRPPASTRDARTTTKTLSGLFRGLLRRMSDSPKQDNIDVIAADVAERHRQVLDDFDSHDGYAKLAEIADDCRRRSFNLKQNSASDDTAAGHMMPIAEHRLFSLQQQQQNCVTAPHRAAAVNHDAIITGTGALSNRNGRRIVVPKTVTVDCPSNGRLGLSVAGMLPVRVKTVECGGAAEHAGLRVGDAILAVDGGDLSEAPPYVVREVLRSAAETKPGRAIRITISDVDGLATVATSGGDDRLSDSKCGMVGSDDEEPVLAADELYPASNNPTSGVHRDVKLHPIGEFCGKDDQRRRVTFGGLPSTEINVVGSDTAFTPLGIDARLRRQFHDDSSLDIQIQLGIEAFVRPTRGWFLSQHQHAVLFRNVEKLAEIVASRRRLLGDAVRASTAITSSSNGENITHQKHQNLDVGLLSAQCDHLSRLWLDAYAVYESGLTQAFQLYGHLVETRPDFVEFARTGVGRRQRDSDTEKFAMPDLDQFLRWPVTLTHRRWFDNPIGDDSVAADDECPVESTIGPDVQQQRKISRRVLRAGTIWRRLGATTTLIAEL